MEDTAILVVAAGRGSRLPGEVPKQYRLLAGRPVLRRALDTFARRPEVTRIQVVTHPADAAFYRSAVTGLDLPPPVDGGTTRQASVWLGLEALAETAPARVLIHDGARPFVSDAVIDAVLAGLDAADGAVPAIPVSDTLKRAEDGRITGTADRTGLLRAQTPQGFRFAALLAAHRAADGKNFTDDAALAEAAGLSVAAVAGDEANIKITFEDDLARAERHIAGGREIRTGSGYDVHAFGPGASVRIGGIDIPHDRALAGHSDADVALHALTDAILGAIGAGDIGSHFPPSDPQWAGANSARFLRHAANLLAARGGEVVNADLTVVCEAPKIGPHRAAMRAAIAGILAVAPERVSVKATTTEGLGFTGRGEGIAAQATVTVAIDRPPR